MPDSADRAGDVTAELTRRMARLSSWRLLEPFAQENYQVMNYGPGGLISVHVDDRTLGYQQGDFDQDQAHIDWRLGTVRQSPTANMRGVLFQQKAKTNLSSSSQSAEL